MSEAPETPILSIYEMDRLIKLNKTLSQVQWVVGDILMNGYEHVSLQGGFSTNRELISKYIGDLQQILILMGSKDDIDYMGVVKKANEDFLSIFADMRHHVLNDAGKAQISESTPEGRRATFHVVP